MPNPKTEAPSAAARWSEIATSAASGQREGYACPVQPTLRVVRVGPTRVPAPRYATEQAAGLDLHAALAEPLRLRPGMRRLVPTGLKIALPPGHEGQLRPRSGLALRRGVTLVNSPGTIDADYRGEVSVVLINHGHEDVLINPLDRIAQLVIVPVVQVAVEAVEALDETARGEGGYGSTGIADD